MNGRIHAETAMRKIGGALVSLGYKLRLEWPNPYVCHASISSVDGPVARLSMSASNDELDVNVYPADPKSTKLIDHFPRVPIARDPEAFDVVVETLESKFRARLIMAGRMRPEEFLTEGSARAWLGRAIALPAAPEGAEMANLQRDAQEVLKSFYRDAAYRLMRENSFEGSERGKSRHSRNYARMCHEARLLLDGRFARQKVEWERESHVGWLLPARAPSTLGAHLLKQVLPAKNVVDVYQAITDDADFDDETENDGPSMTV